MSITEAEYIVTSEVAKEALWLIRLVREFGILQGGVQLHRDSQSSINLESN